MKPIHGDKLRGHLETLILSVLERGEAHGLEILHRLDQAGCGLLHLERGVALPGPLSAGRGGKDPGRLGRRAARAAWCPTPHLPLNVEGKTGTGKRP